VTVWESGGTYRGPSTFPHATEKRGGLLIPVQFYESTLADRESGLRATILTIPREALPIDRRYGLEDTNQYIRGVLGELGIDFTPPSIDISGPTIGAWPLQRIEKPTEFLPILQTVFAQQSDELNLPGGPRSQEIREFIEFLTFASVVPTEESPLEKKSIASLLLDGGSGLGIFAVGAQFTDEPILLLFGAAIGIIVIGAARGVGAGLQEGLKYRVLKSLRVPNNREEREQESER
jgi:hypothetical protein